MAAGRSYSPRDPPKNVRGNVKSSAEGVSSPHSARRPKRGGTQLELDRRFPGVTLAWFWIVPKVQDGETSMFAWVANLRLPPPPRISASKHAILRSAGRHGRNHPVGSPAAGGLCLTRSPSCARPANCGRGRWMLSIEYYFEERLFRCQHRFSVCCRRGFPRRDGKTACRSGPVRWGQRVVKSFAANELPRRAAGFRHSGIRIARDRMQVKGWRSSRSVRSEASLTVDCRYATAADQVATPTFAASILSKVERHNTSRISCGLMRVSLSREKQFWMRIGFAEKPHLSRREKEHAELCDSGQV